MTEEVENLMLEHLKRIQTDLSRSREEQRTAYSGQIAIQQTLNAHSTLLHQCVEDVAGLRVRLDRIERRLDLVDHPDA
jgi:ubiquinone biosynthesis protein UbiJ